MARSGMMALSVAIYGAFFATFLYLIGFTGGFALLPRTVDAGGPVGSTLTAVAVDAALIALFGVQHSVMARPAFKARWTRIVPPPLERSVYVLFASLALILLFALWRPIPQPIWTVASPAGAALLWALFAIGWLLVLVSTYLINHFELFGLQQAWLHLRRRTAAPARFRTPLLYRVVRHPLYSGFFLAFWSTPRMTVGHLLLAIGMGVYTLIAIGHEERDLVDAFGDEYRDYQAATGMLIPGVGRRH